MELETKSKASKLSNHSALKLQQKHGISRNSLNCLLVTHFHFPTECRKYLSRYEICHLTGEQFKHASHEGMLRNTKTGKSYVILYQDCNQYSAKRAIELKLSFREALEEFDLPAYVIVRIVNPAIF